ncbi:MAG: aminopeptidase P family N-terminal domain-containing protein, partial [Gemmatimonadaceae bacterium]
MPDPRAGRVAALREAVQHAHLDGVLVTSLPNIRYLTGFGGSSALLMVTARDVLLITDFRYATQVRDEVGDFARIIIDAQSIWGALFRAQPDLAGVEIAGFESAHLLHRDAERILSSGNRWQWRATTDLVEGLREQKDADEVAAIAAAVEIAERALGRTLDTVRA